MDALISLRKKVKEDLLATEMVKELVCGKPNKNHYIGYVVNVYNYALHSAPVIALAGSRCVHSHPELSDYLFLHAQEELGHDKWAFNDLRELGLSEEMILSSRPGLSCASMVGLEYYYAGHANPVGLFGWLYTLECLGGDLGGSISDLIDQGLGLNGKGVKFVRGHGEADEQHSEDLIHQIGTHVKSKNDLEEIVYVAELSTRLYVGILKEVYERNEQWV
jgi:Iron-containing redox enzyme